AKLPPEIRATAGEIQVISAGGLSSANIQMAIQGPDLDKLTEYATRITNELKKVPGAVDVDNTLVIGKPEITASIDRDRAAALGRSVADVGTTLQMFVAGFKVSSYAEGGEEYDIRMRADARFRADPSTLATLTVPSTKYGVIPLSSVISTKPGTG